MNIYEIDDGEQWWYAAESKERALQLHIEPLVPEGTDLSDLSKVDEGKYLPCLISEMEVSELSSETVLPVRQDDEDGIIIEKTAAEWAAEGEGLVGCTVW